MSMSNSSVTECCPDTGRTGCGPLTPSTLRPEPSFGFDTALIRLKEGFRLRRKGWNGKGIFIKVQMPDANSFMTSPYIYIDTSGLETENRYAPKSRVPWLASQTDLLSEDWEVVK